MSRQHSRSPLRSRPPPLLGRRDGYYGEQYHALVRSDPWRGSETVDNRTVEGGLRWDSGSSQEVGQVDHWAKFIEAIGRAGKRKASSSMSRYHAQDGVQSFEDDAGHSPRQLPRERLSSPEAPHYSVETHQRIQSPGQRRSAHDAALVDRRSSRSSSPRHSKAKRHDRAEHVYHDEEREDRYERSSYSERSLKSNYMAHELHFKEYQDLDLREGYTVSPRGFSPHCAPVIVEHDHGIPKDDARIHNPGRDRERQRSRDPARERGHPRNRNPSSDRECPRSRDPVRDRERPRSRDLGREREQPRTGGLVRDQERPMSRDPVSQREQPRSSGSVREREHPRSRDAVSRQEHPRSRDLVRDREQPSTGGPVRHQEHPGSRDSIKDRERTRSRDPQRTTDLSRNRDFAKSSELQRGRDPTRGRESSRSQEGYKQGRDYNHNARTSHDSSSSSSNYHVREDARFRTSSAERGSPLLGLRHHKEQPRMGSLSRELHGQRAVDDAVYRMDESKRARASLHDWEEETQTRGSHGGVLRQEDVLKRNPQHRSPSHPGTRMDFAETLKIKVDMSRPVGQSSQLGYSSERQLSLDLVNVGRQRLDFLPMLEHSGTFRETPMHSGTFAQEIITLVHQVKENYFQGYGVTLNERFSNEQEYSMADEFAEDEQETEGLVNRPLSSTSLDTQIFCKIAPMQSQRKPHVPAPGDLRHDLERKRQERLEGVKITITGGSFSRILPQSQENESTYAVDEDPCERGWSEEAPQRTEHWNNPRPKRPVQIFTAKRNRIRNRPRQRMKRNANNGARW